MNNPKTKIEKIVVQDFENEVLIYDLNINKAFCLNQTSALVWELCDGKHSIAEISRILSRELNEPVTEDLVWLALDQFKQDSLLEDEQFEINFNGLSRRQVIKKIGFASMVALPVIASVVAPSALMAQSGPLPLLAACSAPSQCQSGNCIPCSGVACAGSLTCCVPGVTGNAPGSTFGLCHDVGSCNALAPNCCSNMTTLVPDPGNCFPNQDLCRCA